MRDRLSHVVRRIAAASMPAAIAAAAFALILVALVTAGLLAVFRWTDLRDVSIVYLVPVLISAMLWGAFPAVVAALAGIAASAFFFYHPLYDLRVQDPQQIVNLVLFVVVAVVTGQLATRLRSEVERAGKREAEIRALHAFSRRLAGSNSAADIFDAIQQHLSTVLARPVVLFGPIDAGATEPFGAAAVPPQVRAAVGQIHGAGREREPRLVEAGAETWLVRQVAMDTRDLGVIAINLGGRVLAATEAIPIQIDAMLADASTTLDRLGVAQAIGEARMRAETERFREALIGSVSHELRTPLATILGAATVFSGVPAIAAEPRLAALAGLVRDEAERLNREIQNLLDASRISGEGLRPRLEWTDPADIVNAALERRRNRLGDRRVEIELAPELPLIYVDSTLIEQALGQVLDNAAKFSPAASCITLKVRRRTDEVLISVTDSGLGISEADRARLGERFFRAARTAAATTGTGLGLWIADAFLRANGGGIEWASEGDGRGATVTLRVPAHPVEAPQRELAYE